jgi:cytochrome c
MQKVIITLFLVVMLACHSTRKTTKAAFSTVVNENQQTAGNNQNAKAVLLSVDKEKALKMIAEQDCVTCHKIIDPNVGPSFTDVAKKYIATEANINKLSQKIISGGHGNWGKVPMTPHPNLSIDSAKIIVRFILSLGSK